MIGPERVSEVTRFYRISPQEIVKRISFRDEVVNENTRVEFPAHKSSQVAKWFLSRSFADLKN